MQKNHFPPVRLATLGIAILSVCITARAAEPTTGDDGTSREQIMQELTSLREQVRQLEQKQTTQETKVDAKQAGLTVDQVLQDADRRSQMMQAQGFTAGYSNGKFLIQSEDGNFVLNPQFWLQLRYNINYRAEDASNKIDGDADTEHGFELRRMKFIFEGNAFSPKFKYRFQFNTDRNDGDSFLEDGYVSYKLNDMFTIKGGQYKEPTLHEELMSDVRQLAVERSLVNATLGGGVEDRVQGVALIIDDGPEGYPWRAEVGYTDGPNSKNTNFVDGGGNAFLSVSSPDFGVYGRFDYLFFGDWKSYEDFTALGNTEPLLVAGAGVSYSQAGDNQLLLHTVDVQYEHGLLGAYAAYLGAYEDNATAGSLYDYGFLAQAGYLINNKWEPFVRYEFIKIDSKQGDFDDYHVIAAGVNYYVMKHAAKFTVDLSYLPNGSPINADGLGILNPDADTDQLVLRGQFQLML